MKIINYNIEHKVLKYKKPARTSRGAYTQHDVHYVSLVTEDGRWAKGECAPLLDLNPDSCVDYVERLHGECEALLEHGIYDYERLRNMPSVAMGIETALRKLECGAGQKGECRLLVDNAFTRGETAMQINGLIWMDSAENMHKAMLEKVKSGFRCIKLKVGNLDWAKEYELIRNLRESFEDVEIRLDANGAFGEEEALKKLEQLSKLKIHSIEQPIRQGNWKKMAELCRLSPVDIALDEELIGVNDVQRKEELLEVIKPQYVILKPTLHGGFTGAEEWIASAKKAGVKWWATSALESNVGLSAIAQWVSAYEPEMPQGLGTGALYVTNAVAETRLEGDMIYYGIAE